MGQLSLFDYAALDSETRLVVQQRTSEIKTLMRKSANDIIEIGLKVEEVKARLGHGRFGAWIEQEFGWSEQSVRNFMAVAEHFKSPKFGDLNIAPSALYSLAAPSVPQPARDEAMARAEKGETITYTKAKEIVASHKPTPTPPAPAPAPQSDAGDAPELPWRGEEQQEEKADPRPGSATPGPRKPVLHPPPPFVFRHELLHLTHAGRDVRHAIARIQGGNGWGGCPLSTPGRLELAAEMELTGTLLIKNAAALRAAAGIGKE